MENFTECWDVGNMIMRADGNSTMIVVKRVTSCVVVVRSMAGTDIAGTESLRILATSCHSVHTHVMVVKSEVRSTTMNTPGTTTSVSTDSGSTRLSIMKRGTLIILVTIVSMRAVIPKERTGFFVIRAATPSVVTGIATAVSGVKSVFVRLMHSAAEWANARTFYTATTRMRAPYVTVLTVNQRNGMK